VSTLTYENLLASIKQVHDIMAEHTPVMPPRIIENPLCMRQTDRPNRRHKVKRWMSEQYHYRIQKKWIKRWGYAKEPTAYMMPAVKLGISDRAESIVVMHPILAAQLRAQAHRERARTGMNDFAAWRGTWL
jgi:hypothetical protein